MTRPARRVLLGGVVGVAIVVVAMLVRAWPVRPAEPKPAEPKVPRSRATAVGEGVGFGVADKAGLLSLRPRRIAYVVHLRELVPGILQTICDYLCEAVDNLHEDQAFLVVFYGDAAQPMPDRRILPATRGRKRLAEAFIKCRTPADGSDPRPALSIAMGCRPDLLYFLASGAVPEGLPAFVDSLDPGGAVQVYTICYLDFSAEPAMREIARRHRGGYTKVVR